MSLWKSHRESVRPVLSEKESFGDVRVTPSGAIEIQAHGQAVRLSVNEYWELMEMLSEASRRLMEETMRIGRRQWGKALDLASSGGASGPASDPD
jgi:hypothetical protein